MVFALSSINRSAYDFDDLRNNNNNTWKITTLIHDTKRVITPPPQKKSQYDSITFLKINVVHLILTELIFEFHDLGIYIYVLDVR